MVVSQFVDYPEFYNAIAECGFYNKDLLPKVSIFCSGHISGFVVKNRVCYFSLQNDFGLLLTARVLAGNFCLEGDW